MLFFNFVCLLYLMVLIDSHTISRNIAYDTLDDIVDSINDLEGRREYRPRHDRLHHSYRREEKEVSRTTREKEDKKVTKAATIVRDVTLLKATTRTEKPVTKTQTSRTGFWNKFRNRLGNKKSKPRNQNELYKRRALSRRHWNRQHIQTHPNKYMYKKHINSASTTSNDPWRKLHNDIDKRKREISPTTISSTPKNLSSRSFFTTHITSKPEPTFKFSTIKTYTPASTRNDLTKVLTDLTTRLSTLKHEYGMNKLKTNPLSTMTTKYKDLLKKIPNISTTTDYLTTTQTTEDVDFLGTAQIEALLNDIKVKAVQMVAEQNPAITDIITNTVTETTFEVDPMLTHMSIGTPGYALSTFISIDGPYSKRTAKNVNTTPMPNTNETVVITNTEPTHQIRGRSISEDVYTISQTIEDALQKGLKKLIKKVQGKMSTQLDKEMHHVKTTIKKKVATIMKDMSKAPGRPPTAVTRPMTTPKKKTNKHRGPVTLKQRHAPKYNKNVSKYNKNVPKTTVATRSTFDDYLMLTLFEQILAKTHEDNVLKMLATTESSIDSGRHFRLEKRGVKTTAKIKDDAKFYEDILPIDLLDYGSKTEPSTEMYGYPTESAAEDTSYEGLSNKISYNDYVNGYKHYLKFQKEQGQQNFSNLVKYQAHRHHSVEDIGKFILDKIPQLPTRRRKRFSDEDVMEDQDISTKSDDSWFKKHFYLFIDNGPPRKFHTSQTVELKSPITDANYEAGTESTVNSNDERSTDDDSIENSLEALSKSLDDRKVKQFSNIMPVQVEATSTKIVKDRNKSNSSDSLFRFGSLRLVDKLFGKDRTPKHSVYEEKDEEDPFETEREKRNPKGHEDNVVSIENAPTHSVRSTKPGNNGYVDINLIPRPTAVVKLRADKQNTGKLRKFLNKFRFRKRKKNKETKKHERTKRQYRVQRFNPLKKLKEIFKVKTPEKPAKENYDIPDYEMMTSHIDTFKPVKYNKVPTIDEIKGQIPNITEERHNANLKPGAETSKHTSKTIAFDWPLENPSIPEVYETTPTAVIDDTTPNYSAYSGPRKTTPRKYQLAESNMKKFTKFKPFEDTNTAFDVNDYKYDSTTEEYLKKYDSLSYGVSSPAMSSLDDIKKEINSLQKKLSPLPMSTQKLAPEISTSKFKHYYVANKKIYVPPHIQAMSLKPSKTENKDLKIQTQLTRIAKFPLSHFHHSKGNSVIDAPQINSNQKMIVQKRTIMEPKKKVKKYLNTYVTVSHKYAPAGYNDFAKADRYKPYPDYFNDLLMWHGDLLNTDRVTVPQWENVLESLKKDVEFTTLSMTDMQRELMQINEFLGNNEPAEGPMSTTKVGVKGRNPMKVKKDKTRSNEKLKTQNYFKTVAVQDNTIAKADDIVIQGAAKYFHFVKQPDFNQEKYMQATDLINNLNEMYLKSPVTKYNSEEKVRDTKRNGQFWKIDNEDKNKNLKDQDSSSVLYLDTTLLAYDDGPDFLVDRPKHKKMSKTSQKPAKIATNHASYKPVAKTNQSPIQYFSTPLPMRMNEFEQFLKDNQLDVQSVTTPLMALPQFVDAAHSTESGSKMKNSKANYEATTEKPKVTEIIGKKSSVSEYNTKKLIDEAIRGIIITRSHYTNEVIDKAIRKVKDVDRRKRYPDMLNDRFFTFEPFRKKAKAKKKFFEKKQSTSPVTDLYTDLPPMSSNSSDIQNEVELTIINMDEINQAPNKKVPQSPKGREKAKTEKAKHFTTRHSIETTTEANNEDETTVTPFIQRIHNSLLYNHRGHKEKDRTSTITTENVKDEANERVATEDISSTTLHPLLDSQFLSKLHPKHHPKRIRISSHNYKYDIVYHNEPDRWMKNSMSQYKRDHIVKYTSGYKDDEYKPPYNSESCHVVKIVRAIEAIENSTRPNVVIHIDLPTYYTPETGSTENLVVTTPASLWNEFLMKRLSGIALLELLNKYGLLRTFDGILNVTDGVDKAVNASKVFSIADKSARGREMRRNQKLRYGRQATDSSELMYTKIVDKIDAGIPNWREKRRLKLFSNIKGKLKTLLRKPHPTSSTQRSTREETTKDKAATKLDAEEHKKKREKKVESNEQGFTTVDYGFDIDRLFDKTSAFGEDKKIHKEDELKGNAKTQTNPNSLLSTDEFPDLNPLSVLKDTLNEAKQTSLKEAKTSHVFTDSPLTTPDAEAILKDINSETTAPLKQDKLITTTSNSALTSSAPTKTKEKAKSQKINEEIYFDPILDKKCEKLSTVKTTAKPVSKLTRSDTKLEKRELQTRGSYTAKDVAALEVIVDLVKNPSNYEEQDAVQAFTESFFQNRVTSLSSASLSTPTVPMNSSVGTNSIQVHIAIPYNLNMDKKRSIDPLRVRRVFAAKMFTPVDLEYQVQSFEDSTVSKFTSSSEDPKAPFIGPKMYLLIDTNGSLARSNFTLQPLKGKVDLSNVRVRQADSLKVLTQKIETTSSGKNLGKVTLSKSFVAAVNKHLVQLYENLTAVNDSRYKHNVRVRKTSYYDEGNDVVDKGNGFRRHINWETVKKYFGHDRVCNCKCKPNKTMCRACAASDAVISELIFEFDNLAQYMKDHCTEIQTFFWMNPSGGKKLRDSVHNVDRTLHDYYKRVRGKCKGRTCNTFSTCFDKRAIVKKKKMPKKYIGDPLIVDLQMLADDIETASRMKIYLTDNLLEGGETMINAIGDCIRYARKATGPPTATAKKNIVKNMYSLDNINVNIICKADSSVTSTTKYYPGSTVASLVPTSALNYMTGHMLSAYDYEPEIRPNKKHKGSLRSYAKNKIKKFKKYKFNDIFTYYVTKDQDVTEPVKMFRKRQTNEQIESPLISDSGGAFCHNYLKGNTLYTKLVTVFSDKTSTTPVNIAHDGNSKSSLSQTTSKISTVAHTDNIFTSTLRRSKKHVYNREVNPADYSSMDTLTHNINELFKIFRNLTDLGEIESMSARYTSESDQTPTQLTTESLDANETYTRKHTTKAKHKKIKTTNIFKTIKSKFHFKHKHNHTKTSTDISLPEPEPKRTHILKDLDDLEETSATENEESSTTPLVTYKEESSSLTTPAVTETVVTSTESSTKPTKSPTMKATLVNPTTSTKTSVTETKAIHTKKSSTTKPTPTKKEEIGFIRKTIASFSNKKHKSTTSTEQASLTSKEQSTLASQEESSLTSKAQANVITKKPNSFITKEKAGLTTIKPTESTVSLKDELTSPISNTTIAKLESTAVTAIRDNFFSKIKTATITFLHNKMKSFHKESTTTEGTDEIRKSRSPATSLNMNFMVDSKESLIKNTEPTLNEARATTVNEMTINNPTILIINDYETEMEPTLPNLGEGFTNFYTENIAAVEGESELDIEENLRSILLSILNYEAKKLNNEWKRYKKTESQIRNYHNDSVTANNKRSIFTLQLSSRPITTHKSAEDSDYDILRTLKDLQLPTPKGLETVTETKGGGLLHKIASKFGVRVVSTSPEKPRQHTAVTTPETMEPATLQTTELTTPETVSRLSSPHTGTIKRKPSKHKPKLIKNTTTVKPKGHKHKYVVTKTRKRGKSTKRKQFLQLKPKYSIMPHTVLSTSTPTSKKKASKEAVDSNPGKRLCDIGATFKHVLDMQDVIPKRDFESLASKLSCFQYKRVPEHFVIKYNDSKRRPHKKLKKKKWKKITATQSSLKWDWIRRKRSLGKHKPRKPKTKGKPKETHDSKTSKENNDQRFSVSNKVMIDNDGNFGISGLKVSAKGYIHKNVKPKVIKLKKDTLEERFRHHKLQAITSNGNHRYMDKKYEDRKISPKVNKIRRSINFNDDNNKIANIRKVNKDNYNTISVERDMRNPSSKEIPSYIDSVVKNHHHKDAIQLLKLKHNEHEYNKPKKDIRNGMKTIYKREISTLPITYNDNNNTSINFDDNSPSLFNDVNFVTDDNEYYEPFVKDEFGIYRSRNKRHKRTPVGILQLAASLQDLPFASKPNETYAMLGDSVIIHCATSRNSRQSDQGSVRWKTDRNQLELDNVSIEGTNVFIKNVEANNLGVYTCQRGNSQKNVKLTVITLPTFKVVVTPVYSLKERCVYSDLKAVQLLGPIMGQEFCSEDQHCSVTVEEPICLEDRLDRSMYLRATAVVTLTPHQGFRCGGHCRRDLHNSLALLAAANAPVLASIGVVISNNGVNKTLGASWSSRSKKAIVTHTLRRKDSVLQDHRYHVDLAPGSVGFVALCPAGYYLVSGQKICAACPTGSWSQDGANACSTSLDQPNGQVGARLRRCQWWWCPGCGYCAAWWAGACACAAAAALAHARRPAERAAHRDARTPPHDEAGAARARPLSPSRVILAKFFRGSRSYTRATDSQETKFGLWKEQHSPPPLPPIDFDL